ncbi:PAS domain-containing sensor histidine kinase [Salinarimonas soli]|uniref:Blue-light-activated histidine kinase n=1 Tax=Salinarimonas soli TaxID=1638099 RepID=A0A5B2V702_9HYPH|nr:PAS domain S-box protein [Salinarimonas soli]KAA2234744.1 PAS domain S-box protein [Salinarimonas soli]
MIVTAPLGPSFPLTPCADVAELIAENAADAIFVMDAEGRITFANPAAERIFGWPRGEMVGQVLHDLLHHHHPDGRPYPRHECPVAQAYRTGETLAGHEDVFFRKDGSAVSVSCSNAPLVGSGTVIGSILTVQDVSERKRAEIALRESEAFLRSVLNSSPDCVKVVDLDGHLVFMNGPGLCVMEIDDFSCIQNKAWADLWPVEAGERINLAVAEARQGRTTRFSAFCPTAKGTPRWWEVAVSPVMGAEGQVVSVLSVSRDVTEKKRQEDALEAALARNADILESINDYYYALDPEWRFTAVNRKVEERTGKCRNEIIGRLLWDVFPKAAPAAAYGDQPGPADERRVLNREVFSSELGIWVEATVYRDHRGTEVYFRDISKRKAIEQALIDREARFRTLAEAIPQLVWSARPDGSCDYLNPRWVEFTGVPEEHHHGLRWLEVVHPEDRPRTAKAWENFIAGRSAYDVDYRLRSRMGVYRWFQARAVIQHDQDGRATRIFGTSTDITDKKDVEEQQLLMARELHHRVKNTLATVQAVISATARKATTTDEFYQAVTDRIVSLSRTHTLLVNNEWGGATVTDIFRSELAPYNDESSSRIILDGPPVQLSSELALALGMAAHELTTNAAKYGALSLPDGCIQVRWSVVREQDAWLTLEWVEQDGPPVEEPTRKGFGSVLLERVLGRQVSGEVKVEFAPDGLRVRVRAPLTSSHEPSEPDTVVPDASWSQ